MGREATWRIQTLEGRRTGAEERNHGGKLHARPRPWRRVGQAVKRGIMETEATGRAQTLEDKMQKRGKLYV